VFTHPHLAPRLSMDRAVQNITEYHGSYSRRYRNVIRNCPGMIVYRLNVSTALLICVQEIFRNCAPVRDVPKGFCGSSER